MTRKRFIKLLMSIGFSRNDAIIRANIAQKCMNYEICFEVEMVIIKTNIAIPTKNNKKYDNLK